MKLKWTILAMSVVLLLTGCSMSSADQSAAAVPTLAPPPVENFERSGPITVSPVRVALGATTEIKVDGLAVEEMKSKGIALLDPQGNKLQTITGLEHTQSVTIPEGAQPGSYKIWLADRSLAPSSGITIVVLDVYDPVPVPLRDPEPTKILETYLQAVNQKNYELAWQCLAGTVLPVEDTWVKAMEQSIASLSIQRYTTLQPAVKTTDTQYKIQVEITAKLKPNAASADWTSGKNVRYVSFTRQKQGWRISRIAPTP